MDHSSILNQLCAKIPIFNQLNNIITEEEVHQDIKQLKNGKSPWPDRISNEMLKSGNNLLRIQLCKVFNSII